MNVKFLKRGDMVQAARFLLAKGVTIQPDTLGVVYERINPYTSDGGPIVRWFTGQSSMVFEGDVDDVVSLNEVK
jgi:hypothetical protein